MTKPKKPKLTKLAKRVRDPNSRYWLLRADAAWPRVIRAAGKCEICGQTQLLNAHYILPRELLPWLHESWNGLCLCARCHKWDPTISLHLNPIWFER